MIIWLAVRIMTCCMVVPAMTPSSATTVTTVWMVVPVMTSYTVGT